MNNLNLPMVASNQNQKEVTINDQAVALDAAFSEVLAVDLSAADATLTKDEFTRNFLLQCSGNTVARTVTVFAGIKRLFAVENQGSEAVNVTAGGASVNVPAGNVAILHCDGTDVLAASTGANAGIADAPDGSPHVRVAGDWLKLLAGDNVTLDDATPGELTVKAAGGIQSIVAGANVSVDDDDPANPIVSASGGGGASLPDMTGNAGKVLAVNTGETAAEWVAQSGGGGGRWPPFQPPLAANLTTVTGGSTVFSLTDDPDVGLQIVHTPSASDSKSHLAYVTLTDPSKDWEMIAHINYVMWPGNSYYIGIFATDSIGGRIQHFGADHAFNIVYLYLPGLTGWTSTPYAGAPEGLIYWFRMRMAADTLTIGVSPDGKTWVDVYSASATAYFANRPDRVGVGIVSNRSFGSILSCDYFSLTGPAV